MPSVVVVGCGVIGLSTALVAKGRGYDVTIISLATPDDTSSDPNYTSDNATTHWRSSADFAPVAVRERQRQWDKQTFQTLWLLAADPVKLPNGNLGPRDPKSAKGISKVTERHVFPSKPHGWTEPFYKRFIPNFRYLKPADLPKGMKFGFEYTTVSIHPDQYLGYLLRSFRALGGKVVSGVKVASLSEIVERGFDVVVNCTGIGAASLTSTSSSNTTLDSNVYAVRGHNVLIKAPHCTQSTMADPTYIIPLFDGEGTVCVVGTYQPKEGERGEGEMVASMLWKASQLDPAIVVSSEANLLGQNKTMGWLNDDDDDGEDEDVEHGDLFDERAESEEENLEYSEPTSSLDHPLGTSEHLPVTSAAPPRWQQASPNHISSSTVDESHFEEELEPQSLPETEDSSDLTDAVEEEVEHATNPMPGDGEQEMSAGSSVEHALQDEESLDPDHAPDEFSEKKTKSMDHESEERASHGNDDFAKDDHEEEGVEFTTVSSKSTDFDSVVSHDDIYPNENDAPSPTSTLDHPLETASQLPVEPSSTSNTGAVPVPSASLDVPTSAFAEQHVGAVEEIIFDEDNAVTEPNSLESSISEEVDTGAQGAGFAQVEGVVATTAEEETTAEETLDDENLFPVEARKGQPIASTIPYVAEAEATSGILEAENAVVNEYLEGGFGGSGSRGDFVNAVEREVEERVEVEPSYPKTLREEIEAQGFSLPPGIEVLKVNVGLRPQRPDDTRLNSEVVVSKQGKKVLVVHNYGHGGWGFQSSWGSSNAAVAEIEKYFPKEPSTIWGKLVAMVFGRAKAKL